MEDVQMVAVREVSYARRGGQDEAALAGMSLWSLLYYVLVGDGRAGRQERAAEA
jgi:hypothetical protein